jgi:hypothetical protein
MEYHPTVHTVVFVSLFLVIYLFVIIRTAAKNSIDLYDLLLLSAVAIVPSFFVYFPGMAVRLARLVGVEFPFVLLFGFLFFVVFVYLYRVVIRLTHDNQRLSVLVQELSLLREEFEVDVGGGGKKDREQPNTRSRGRTGVQQEDVNKPG